MKRSFYSFSIAILSFIFLVSSCETDFRTTAPYKDITVVYGLLDPMDSMQYIKINKAFLGEGNVMQYAMEEDSSEYAYPLDVWVEEWTTSGDSVKSYYFDTTTVYNKEPGQFYYPKQVLYKWQKPDKPYLIQPILVQQGINLDTIGYIYFWLNTDDIYKLKIRNPKTGKMITSETPLVTDFNITKPTPYSQNIKFVPDPVFPKEFAWEKAGNGELYNYEIRFNYRELKSGQDTTDKYITLAKSSVTADLGSNTISVYYPDNNFFSACRNLIVYEDPQEEAKVKDRFSGTVDLIVSVAEQQFTLYLQVNEPSTSIVQEKPQYTNIDNGTGIFSSRIKKITGKRLHTETIAYLNSIDGGILKFQY